MHRYVILAVATVCFGVLVQTQMDMDVYRVNENNNKRTAVRYCGQYLSNILSSVCHGFYNTRFHKKSSYYDSDEDYGYAQQPQYIEEMRVPQFPFRSKTSASAIIPGSFRRYVRGVTDECCRKPCTKAELLSYCDTTSTTPR